MAKLLNVIGVIFIGSGFIIGGFIGLAGQEWVLAFTWWISSVIVAVIFLALAYVITLQEENQAYLQELLRRFPAKAKTATMRKPPNTKMNLSKLKGYTMKSSDGAE